MEIRPTSRTLLTAKTFFSNCKNTDGSQSPDCATVLLLYMIMNVLQKSMEPAMRVSV